MVRYASWLVLASACLLAGCVAAVIGNAGSGSGAATVDARITSAVQGRLAEDAQLRSLGIQVATRDGAVTLSGSVRNAAQAGNAERAARGVVGVTSVTNRLTVK